MVHCAAIDCKHNSLRETCRFFALPKEPRLRAKWLHLLQRNSKCVPKVLRVCSCHFRDGKKENGPELFSYNNYKRFTEQYLSPDRGKRRKKLNISENKPGTLSYPGNDVIYLENQGTGDISINAKEDSVQQKVMYWAPKEEKRIEESVHVITPEIKFESEESITFEEHRPSTSAEFLPFSDIVLKSPQENEPALPEYCLSNSSQIYRLTAPEFIASSGVVLTTSQEAVKKKTPDASRLAGPSVVVLEAEKYFLEKRISELEKEARGGALTFSHIGNDSELCRMYTGLSTNTFMSLYDLLKDIPINYFYRTTVGKVPKIDQMLMCLMKMRRNYCHMELAHRFRVSSATVSNILVTWIELLHVILFKHLNSTIPSREKIETCPSNTLNSFANCRMIIGCAEIATTIPRRTLKNPRAPYDTYNLRNTLKTLIGVAPNGVITYVSPLYPGVMSDRKVVQKCGVLSNFEEGDLIVADEGLSIEDLLPPGVSLNVTQPDNSRMKEIESITRAKVHVDKAVQKMKWFKILNSIPRSLFEYAENIVQVIAALTNLQFSLVERETIHVVIE